MARGNRRKRNKKTNNSNKILSGVIAVVFVLILAIISTNTEFLNNNITEEAQNQEETENQKQVENQDEQFSEGENINENTNLEVYFIDVGQADSILVMNDTQSMLIDAGNNEDGENVVNFIKDKGITKLNYVIRNTST